jgi:hypothetical protein
MSMEQERLPEGNPPLDREKWEVERAYRDREISILERDQTTKEALLEVKRHEMAKSGWTSPIVVAIIAATVAAIGNAGVVLINGNQNRYIEKQQAENGRILEMIKTGDQYIAAENLKFLLNVGLISNPDIVTKLTMFLANSKPGTGPFLPVSGIIAEMYGQFMSESADRMFLAAGVRPPPCYRGVSLPEKLSLPSDLKPLQRAAAEGEYEGYKTRCRQWQELFK